QQWTIRSDGTVHVYGSACLDVHGAGTTSGTPVDFWPCNAGAANQQWHIHYDGTLTAVQSGLCLDVTGGNTTAGNVNGTPMEIWQCNSAANQTWSRHGEVS